MQSIIRDLKDEKRLWQVCRRILLLLGVWLIFAPSSLGYLRVPQMWSDFLCGLLIFSLFFKARSANRQWPRWLFASIGVWLLFAPLAFWSRTKGAYDNGNISGALVIFFATILPYLKSKPGAEVPPGWSYNPSSWPQRLPIIALALIGFFMARYMALYQLGFINQVWEPFFGDGTRKILESRVSKAFPVSDAGLGAFSYLLDAVAGAIGGTRRWRTMPWLVILFGVMIVPPGVTSIVLVILQPVAVGEWCTLCLFAAFVMLFMVAPAFDEVVATIQFLRISRKAGKSFWRTFWKGAELPEQISTGLRTEQKFSFPPWNLILCAALGIWLMFAPSVLNNTGAAAKSDYLIAALIATFSIISLSEILRNLRLLNILLGVWLLIAPWILSGQSSTARWNDLLVGAAVIALSFRRGKMRKQFGSWNKYLV